jgi:hypothetical protein
MFKERLLEEGKWGNRLLGAGVGALGMGALGVMNSDVHDALNNMYDLHQQGQLWNTGVDKVSDFLQGLKTNPGTSVHPSVLKDINEPLPGGWHDLWNKAGLNQEFYGQNETPNPQPIQQSNIPSSQETLALKNVGPHDEAIGQQQAMDVNSAQPSNTGGGFDKLQTIANGGQPTNSQQALSLKNVGSHDEAIGQQQAMGVKPPLNNAQQMQMVKGYGQPNAKDIAELEQDNARQMQVMKEVPTQHQNSTDLLKRPEPPRSEPILNKQHLQPKQESFKLSADTTADKGYNNWRHSMFNTGRRTT